MIELQNFSVGYGETPVLEQVDLSFPTGQVTILVGPNGCGKSTLMRSALGLLPSLSGQALYDGVPLTELSPREIAQKAAYLAQSRNTPNITGYRMVLHGRFPYLSYPRRYRTEDHAAVRTALEQMDAQALSGRLLTTLSGGQRQKIYLAMALAQDTETIFLDEPTTYLDVQHQLEVMAAAKRLAEQGKAVVLVLHDLCLALRTGDRIAVFSQGHLRQLGTPEAVYQSEILPQVFGISVGRVETDNGIRYYYI
jgi:iron complex transport system ATP-binding protein